MADTGLALPFPLGPELESVIKVSYRNRYGTASALVVLTDGRWVVCEHGARCPAPDMADGLELARAPAFCPACRSFHNI
jgi:hypothetical protein